MEEERAEHREETISQHYYRHRSNLHALNPRWYWVEGDIENESTNKTHPQDERGQLPDDTTKGAL